MLFKLKETFSCLRIATGTIIVYKVFVSRYPGLNTVVNQRLS